jgi:arylsulfatase A-like enzyme
MSNDRPNVLFFFTDDQRFNTIRSLGNPEIQTPNIDALVESGTTYTRTHIPGGTSPAVCMPSRAMLATGRTLFHIDHEGQSIPENHTTMGECFRQAGYATFGTGKWHNGGLSFGRSFTWGDEIFFSGMWDHWNVPTYHFDPSGQYQAKSPYIRNYMLSNQVNTIACDHLHPGKHSTELFTDTAIDYITKYDQKKPFLAYVSLMAPHDPRSMPKRFQEMYDPSDIAIPANFQPQHQIDTGDLQVRDELLAAFPRQPLEIQKHIAEYYAMISHLDDALGRLLNTMADRRLLDNTILVFAADNGLAIGQHGLMGKQNLYDHSVRVPLILSGPGIPKGQKRDALTYLLDIFPTLCDLTGIDIPESVEGISFARNLQNPINPTREWLYLAYGSSIRGVTNGEYKCIEYFAPGNPADGRATQLFDLRSDPLETHNLAADPTQRDRLNLLRGQMEKFRDEWDDCKHPLGEAFWRGMA